MVQSSVAVGLVWLMLFGGLIDTVNLSRGYGSDAYWLATRTLIPRLVWQALWIVVAVVCLWSGGRRLLAL